MIIYSHKQSRLSNLSKLNLLGLIDLSIIAVKLKISKDVDQAMKQCQESIQNLKDLNKQQQNNKDMLQQNNEEPEDIGIASQNLIEELYEHLMKVKTKDLDIDEIAQSYSPERQINLKARKTSSTYNPTTHNTNNIMDESEELKFLTSIRNGNKIVTTKEFSLVFYITCFVPFVRPNVPILKESDITKMKVIERERLKKRRQL